MGAVKPTMVALRPCWGHFTVLPSPVDEVERQSGVIVPISSAEHSEYTRGIVLHVASGGIPEDAKLPEGSVVYYWGGARIGDVVVVGYEGIVAYVEDDS